MKNKRLPTVCAAFLALALAMPAFAESRGSRNNAKDVVELFVEACLDHIDDPLKAADYAQSRFPAVPSATAPSFIRAVSPSGGKAWGKKYNRGSHVIVVGNDGSCAVFASLADTPTLIQETDRNLKIAASRRHSASVEIYPDQPGQPANLKRFKLARPDAPTDILVNILPQSDPNYEAVIAAKAVKRMPER